MHYEQVGVSFRQRILESRHLEFQVQDEVTIFEREGFDTPAHPAWGFDLMLEGRGTMAFRQSNAQGFWIPLLMGADGVSGYFRDLSDAHGPTPDELAQQLVSRFAEFSHEKPPPHVSRAACARISQWFGAVRHDVMLRRTPVGRLPFPHLELTIAPVGEGTESTHAQSIASRDDDGVLAIEFAGRRSLPAEGDWAPRVVDVIGESSLQIATAMLAPLLEGHGIEPATLVEELIAEVERWLHNNRSGILAPTSDDDSANAG